MLSGQFDCALEPDHYGGFCWRWSFLRFLNPKVEGSLNLRSASVVVCLAGFVVISAFGCGGGGNASDGGLVGTGGASGEPGTNGASGESGSDGTGDTAGAASGGSGATGAGGSPDASAGAGGAAAGGGGGAPEPGTPKTATILTQAAVADIALGGGYVYFMTEDTIQRVAIGGGAAESVYKQFTTSGPRFIDADDTRLVWTEHAANTVFGAVRSCPLGACAAPTEIPRKGESSNALSIDGALVVWTSATNRTLYSSGGFSASSPGLTLTDVAAEGGDVFWLDGGLLTTVGAVYKSSEAGAGPTIKLSAAVGNPSKISVQGDHVVVISDTGVFQMSRDGSGLTRLADGSATYFVDIVTDGTQVYWAIDKGLFGCTLAACVPAMVDTSTGASAGLELDATHLYWGTGTSIRRFDL